MVPRQVRDISGTSDVMAATETATKRTLHQPSDTNAGNPHYIFEAAQRELAAIAFGRLGLAAETVKIPPLYLERDLSQSPAATQLLLRYQGAPMAPRMKRA